MLNIIRLDCRKKIHKNTKCELLNFKASVVTEDFFHFLQFALYEAFLHSNDFMRLTLSSLVRDRHALIWSTQCAVSFTV